MVDPSKSQRLIPTFGIKAWLHSGIMSHSSARGDGDSRRLSLSPPVRRPCRGVERVIERVIEKSSSAGIVYPTLTRTNYTEWSLVMKVNLQAAGLWDVIESSDGDYRDD
jgi:hypothetical protein